MVNQEPIAIIGMACRFPGGATTPELYWRVLQQAEAVPLATVADRSPLSSEHAELSLDRSVPPAALLADVDAFDAPFFGLNPTEAEAMDPQHRLLLEVSWEALERAGQAPDQLAGTNTAVFVGIISPDYLHRQFQMDSRQLSPYAFTGSMLSMAAGRLSYLLDLRGPAQAVESACSSSLLAVHHAVRQLRSRDSDLALAGGVNLILLSKLSTVLSEMGALSPSGRSRTFEAGADGYGRAEGCGMLVLKRLADATADDDHVLAVIRGSAVNQDGRSNGITVPSRQAQADVIRAALTDAGLAARDVDYVECHGTGTAVGDPIEVDAISSVLGTERPADRPLRIGSAKAVIGHAEAAAGIAGLMKAVLCLEREEIPAQPLGSLNPALSATAWPIEFSTDRVEWSDRHDHPRVAGVSAFGFSGTNAHVLIQQAPRPRRSAIDQPSAQVLTLSARSEGALRQLAGSYADHLRTDVTASVPDICHTANTGRSQFAWRAAVAGHDADQLAAQLTDLATGGHGPRRVPRAGPPRTAFLFSGQGNTRVGMGRALYATFFAFREVVDECSELARASLGCSLVDFLYPNDATADGTPILDAALAQPAVFVVQAALTRLWAAAGVAPAAVAGHSLGEYAAACAAGALSWDDGLRLVVERGRLVATLPVGEGAMLAVFAAEAEVHEAVVAQGADVSIAAINGPAETVLTGPADAIEAMHRVFAGRGISSVRLDVGHALHSQQLDPVLDQFEEVVARFTITNPRLPLVGNLTGTFAAYGELADARRWRRHMREPVRYADTVQTLVDDGVGCFLEIGPDSTLTGIGQRTVRADVDWVGSLRHGRNDLDQLLGALGTLYTLGVPVDPSGLDRHGFRRRCVLPTYPFERRRLWLGGLERATSARPVDDRLPGRRVSSPLPQAQYEIDLDYERHASLPDTGGLLHIGVFVELIVGSVRESAGIGALRLEEFAISDALVVPPGTRRTVQTIVATLPPGAEIRVMSAPDDNDQGKWREHARTVVVSSHGGGSWPNDLDGMPRPQPDPSATEHSGTSFYHALQDRRGVALGPSVALIEHLWRQGRTVWAQMRPGVERSRATGFALGLFDACLQMFNVSAVDDADLALFTSLGTLYLPAIRDVPDGALSAVAVIEGEDDKEVRGRFVVYTGEGSVVAAATSVTMRRVPRAVLTDLGLSSVQTVEHGTAGGASSLDVSGMTPADARERLLAEVRACLGELLGVAESDVDDSMPLVAIGVDSILATQLSGTLTARLGVPIPLRALLGDASAGDVAVIAAAAIADAVAADSAGPRYRSGRL